MSVFCQLGKHAKPPHPALHVADTKKWSCVSWAILIQIPLLTLCNVFWGVLVKFFPPLWNHLKVLAVRKIAKCFWIGVKLLFAFLHFHSHSSKSFTQTSFSLTTCLSLLRLLYFLFSISFLPWKSLIQPSITENVLVKKRKTWSLGHSYVYKIQYNNRRFAEVFWI